MTLDGEGGVFVLDREADPNRYGLRNGAVFRLDLAQRTFEIHAAAADFRGPICGVVAPDGYLYLLDRDVSLYPGSEARGAIYRVDGMGNTSLVIASRQFRRPSGFAIDPQGQMIVSDPYADPRNRGTDTGAIFRRINLESEFRVFSAPASYVNPYGFFVRDDLTPIEITDLEAVAVEEGIRISWQTDAAQFDGFFCMRADGVDPDGEEYQILNPDEPIPGRGPYEYLDRSVAGSETYTYQILGLLPGGSQRFYGPVTATAPALRSFALLPPRPNPMRGTTTLAFDLPFEGLVDLHIYDLLGRSIRRLSEGTMPGGRYEIVWDGRNDRGHPVASGIYLVRLGWRDRVETGRIVFLR
jgi:hypothetical protein